MNRVCEFNEVFWYPFSKVYKSYGNTVEEAERNLMLKSIQKNLDIFRLIPIEYQENDLSVSKYCGIIEKDGYKIYNKVFTGFDQKKQKYIAFLIWCYGKTKKDVMEY